MAYPKLEIYPRANALTGTEDVLISQGRVNKKVSTQAIADLAASTGTLGSGTVPVWGDVSAFVDGDLLAIDGGLLVKASNASASIVCNAAKTAHIKRLRSAGRREEERHIR